MNNVVISLLMIVLLTSCATNKEPNYYWDREGGVNQQRWKADARECVDEGMRAAPMSNGSNRTYATAADSYAAAAESFLNVGRIFMQRRATDNCFIRKGYYKAKKR